MEIYGLDDAKGVGLVYTFNFINIAWVFFRAKEWDDAVKVLKGMINMDNVNIEVFIEQQISIIKNIYSSIMEIVVKPMDDKLSYFLNSFFNHFRDDSYMFIYIILSTIIVVLFQNSTHMIKVFSVNFFYLFIHLLLFVTSIYILSFGIYSEFLYFNF